MNGPEHLCTWFLRLNGYLTTTNFCAHDKRETLGEIDVIGVRFPHSQELHFEDCKALKIPAGKIDVVLAEAKRGHIDSLDNSWISPEKQALEYIVQRVGIVHSEKVAEVCAALRKNRQITVDDRSFRVICCARSMNDDSLVARPRTNRFFSADGKKSRAHSQKPTRYPLVHCRASRITLRLPQPVLLERNCHHPIDPLFVVRGRVPQTSVLRLGLSFRTQLCKKGRSVPLLPASILLVALAYLRF